MAQAEAEAKAMRDEAEAILTPARQEAERLVAEARVHAMQIVSDAEGECERLAAQAEQYKLLAADVQRRSVDFLQRALEALGADTADSAVAGDGAAPFRRSDQRAVGE
jgi:cell division septum initiation protein DivIVA